MAPLRLLLPLAVAALTPLALAACGAAPSGDAGGKPPAQNPAQNPVVRSVNGMTAAPQNARDAAGAMNQRNAAAAAAAANAVQ